MGFEPTVRCRTHAFQAGALNHSATPPLDFLARFASLGILTPAVARWSEGRASHIVVLEEQRLKRLPENRIEPQSQYQVRLILAFVFRVN